MKAFTLLGKKGVELAFIWLSGHLKELISNRNLERA